MLIKDERGREVLVLRGVTFNWILTGPATLGGVEARKAEAERLRKAFDDGVTLTFFDKFIPSKEQEKEGESC